MTKSRRGKDGYFSVTLQVGRDETGKRIRKRIRSKTLAGLKEKQQSFERDCIAGVKHGAKPTVAAHLHSWIDQVVSQRNRSTTVYRYRRECNVYIIPALGHVPIDKLTSLDVQRLINTLSRTLSAPTVRNIHATLQQALRIAVRWGLVARNVAEQADLPKAARTERKALNSEQARQLLEGARGDRYEALYWVALLLGLRRGELLGLRWKDIDFVRRELSVSCSLQREHKQDGPSQLVFAPPKTKRSNRVLPIPPILIAVLMEHRQLQDEERQIAGWQEHDLVFPNQLGKPTNITTLHRSFKSLLDKVGLPDIPFHSLRHSCATLLLTSRVDLPTVSSVLGHASAAFTASVYGHALPDETRRAITDLGIKILPSGDTLATHSDDDT